MPKKEGHIRPAATWEEVKRPDSRDIVFMDNNVLASDHGLDQIERMGHENVRVDFNQGLDARLITQQTAKLLAALKWIKFVRMSSDTSAMLPVLEQATQYLREAGIPTWRHWCYVLVQDVDDANSRVEHLREMGITTFAQPYRDYDGGDPTAEQKRFARWCNDKAVFASCKFDDYGKARGV